MYIEYCLIYYIIAELVYSAIERIKDYTFYLLQLSMYNKLFAISIVLKVLLNNTIYSLTIGILFISSSVLPRIIFPKHPIEAGGMAVQENKYLVKIGIIDFVWLSMMGGCLTGILFLNKTPIVDNNCPITTNNLALYITFIEKSIEGCLTIGGVLVAAMAILWAGEIWREKDIEKRIQYKNTVKAAIKMVIALFTIYISIFIWLFIPLFNKLIKFL